MVDHLIVAHGHKRMAFIRGPVSHVSAEQRYKAYRDALEVQGLAFIPDLVSEALPWDSGASASRLLLETRQLQPGRDFTALVAASDLLAFWAMEDILSRGWRIPEDLAIGGFNDSLESSLSSPALSTVAVDFEKEGSVAADILLRLLAGEKVPSETLLPAELRLRRSCGCPTAIPDSLGAGRAEAALGGLPAAGPGRRSLVAAMAGLLRTDQKRSGPWLEALLDGLALETDASDPGSGLEDSPFLSALELALDRTSPEGLEPGGWQPLLSLLRTRALSTKTALSPSSRLEEVFHRARGLAFEASRRAITRAHWLSEQRELELKRAGAALLLCHDLPSIGAALGEALPSLGIPRAWLALAGDRARPGALRLVAALGMDGPPLPPGGLCFDADLVLPQGFLPPQGAFVVEPLFFRDEDLGRLVLEIGPRDGGIYEELRSYLSSALKSAALYGQAEEARRRAEAADLVKTRLMASVSRGLCEPLGRIAAEALALGHEGMGREAAGQLALIEDLLDLSRAELGELELALGLVDPASLLAEVLGTELERALQARPRESLPLVIADKARVARILQGLLGGPGPGDRARLSARLEGNLVLFEGRRGQEAAGDISTARRILGLLGASLEIPEMDGGFCLRLPLPTALGELPSAPRPGLAWELGPELPREEEIRGIGLLSIDLGRGGEWAFLAALRKRPDLAYLPLAVYPPEGLVLPEGGTSRKLSFLDRLEEAWPGASSPPILVLSPDASWREELFGLARACLPGRRIVGATVAEAREGLGAGRPAFILAEAGMAEAWLAKAAPPSLRGLAVLAVLDELCPPGPLVLASPQALILHRKVLPQSALALFLGRLGEGTLAPTSPACLLVKRAQAWLAESYAGQVTRQDLATALGVNGDYLGRLFHSFLGIAPWEYLGRYRTRVACILLEEGQLSLAEVGARVGFTDPAYFSRVFRKFMGVGPREWCDRGAGTSSVV
jgi:AraC-like DNA-binding protein/signal transduction histidine kinase